MADQRRVRNMNEAASRFADALSESYRTVYEQAGETRQRQERLAREFSDLVVDELKERAESGRAASEQLADQSRRQQEAVREIQQESTNAYVEFLNSAFSQYRANTREAAQRAQEGVRAVGQTAASVVGAVAGATRAVTEGAGGLPIAGYDEMNVEEVSKRLNDLSAEELRLLRDYEERNQRRDTLLGQMDRKIRST